MQDKEFEQLVKQEFDKMTKDYDRVHDVLWGALASSPLSDQCICDCDTNYGKDCKYPDKYKDGGCK